MKKLKKGFSQAVVGIIAGLVLTFIINFLADKGIIPKQAVTVYGIISLIINILSMNSAGAAGLIYTVGWMGGSLLFINIMSQQDIVINIVLPAILLAIRCLRWVKKIA